jgi:hypothetical protein
VSARADAERLTVHLDDGRQLTVPLAWFTWLAAASDEQRQDLRIAEGGAGIWWPQLEDGVSVPGLLGLPEYP